MNLKDDSIEVIRTLKNSLQEIYLSLTEPYLTWYEQDIKANGENGDTEALNLMLKSSLSNTYCNRTT
ncbi:MAG TPA: hypothetical protein GX697_05415 [Firmicutes bacterium]|nr:hypothetical protein [Bacillota bacterium]